jgi:hypothetical protein
MRLARKKTKKPVFDALNARKTQFLRAERSFCDDVGDHNRLGAPSVGDGDERM